MSHHQERKEKNCLNCNAEVAGRFCQVCGQENIEPKESFWVLATHFVHDLTHFDGKFFGTLKYLLFKPSFLSQEYLRGRRTSYLHPIRMYVFTSAFFFLIFFNFFQTHDQKEATKQPIAHEIAKLEKEKLQLNKELLKQDSTVDEESKEEQRKKYQQLVNDLLILKKDSTKRDSVISLKKEDENVFFKDSSIDYMSSEHYYDSVQESKPKAARDNFFVRNINKKYFALKLKYNGDQGKMTEAISEKFFHLFPQMLFVSLPLFALILQVLYFRRKQIFYVNHIVFTIHLYCATFILILFSLVIDSLAKHFHFGRGLFGVINYLMVCFYWYKAFKNFYGQSRRKTVFKYVILFFATFFLMAILFAALALLSFFEM